MDGLCHICAQEIPGPNRRNIFAFGRCNHHVCYVCSARLRAICGQFECPICRVRLDNVIFSENKKATFKKFKTKYSHSDKYKIYFESEAVESAFNQLLKYNCQICVKSFEASEDPRAKTASNEASISDKKAVSSNKATGNKNKTSNGNSNNNSNNAVKANKSTTSSGDTSGGSSSSGSSGNSKKLNREHNTACPSVTARRLEEDGPPGLLEPAIVSHPAFDDVFGLKNHLNYVHKLRLCDLCLNHNKLFPFEFSYYDNASLSKHIKEGEAKSSHTGHPACQLCRQIFFNQDELLLHMSREHFPCHLCEARESNMLVYFNDYVNLRNHFRDKHILCERDNCRNEHLTSAFDSEIEYEIHLVNVHRLQRSTITLESAPHVARQNQADSARSLRQSLPRNAAVISTGNVAIANSQRRVENDPNAIRLNRPLVRPQRLPSQSEFPALGQDTATNRTLNQPPATSSSRLANNRPTQSTLSQRLTAGPSSVYSRAPIELNEVEFPSLPEAPKPKVNTKKVTQKGRKRY